MINPFVILGNIMLQTGNPLADWITSLMQPQQLPIGGVVVVAPNWMPMVTFILVGFIIFILYRYFALGKKKANDEEYLGVLEFVVRGQGQFEGFVNQYKSGLSDSYLRGLKRNPKFVKFVDRLAEYRNNGDIHLYQFYYRRTRELLIHTLRRSRVPALIISTAPLDIPEVATGQSEALWSWTTLSSDHVKTVQCHKSTEKFEIEFGTRNEMVDVWMIAPLVFGELRTEIKHRPSTNISEKMEVKEQRFDSNFRLFNLSQGTIEEGRITVKVLPYSEEFAEACPHIVAAAKQVDFVQNMKTQFSTVKGQLRERDNQINFLAKDNSTLEGNLANKPLRYAPPQPEKDNRFDYALWIILGGGVPLLLSQMPRYVQGLQGSDPLMLGFLGLIGVVGVMVTLKNRKENDQKKKIGFEARQ